MRSLISRFGTIYFAIGYKNNHLIFLCIFAGTQNAPPLQYYSSRGIFTTFLDEINDPKSEKKNTGIANMFMSVLNNRHNNDLLFHDFGPFISLQAIKNSHLIFLSIFVGNQNAPPLKYYSSIGIFTTFLYEINDPKSEKNTGIANMFMSF